LIFSSHSPFLDFCSLFLIYASYYIKIPFGSPGLFIERENKFKEAAKLFFMIFFIILTDV